MNICQQKNNKIRFKWYHPITYLFFIFIFILDIKTFGIKQAIKNIFNEENPFKYH